MDKIILEAIIDNLEKAGYIGIFEGVDLEGNFVKGTILEVGEEITTIKSGVLVIPVKTNTIMLIAEDKRSYVVRGMSFEELETIVNNNNIEININRSNYMFVGTFKPSLALEGVINGYFKGEYRQLRKQDVYSIWMCVDSIEVNLVI